MKTTIKILLFLLIPMFGIAQTELNPLNSTPYIEVTGEGEMEIIPDEIYLQFTLKERYDGRTKINIEDLEKKLRQKLRAKGITNDQLYLADADAAYVKIKRKKKDVLASKEYIIEASGTDELAKVWDVLDEVDALNAYIKRVDHSKIEEFKKEVKIKAIKNAKEKASYLLEAVDQEVGKALFIQEREIYQPEFNPRATMLYNASYKDMKDEAVEQEPEISFKKIKLSYKVFARFAIQ